MPQVNIQMYWNSNAKKSVCNNYEYFGSPELMTFVSWIRLYDKCTYEMSEQEKKLHFNWLSFCCHYFLLFCWYFAANCCNFKLITSFKLITLCLMQWPKNISRIVFDCVSFVLLHSNISLRNFTIDCLTRWSYRHKHSCS